MVAQGRTWPRPSRPSRCAQRRGVPARPGALGLATRAGELLAWVPLQRAVLRDGRPVRKFHADLDSYRPPSPRSKPSAPWVPCAPGVRASCPRRPATSSRSSPGRPLGRDDALAAVAPAAAGLLAPAPRAPIGRADAPSAPTICWPCARPVAPWPASRPDLAPVSLRCPRLAGSASGPDDTLVPSHGDFNVGQLLADDGAALTMVDVDTLCLGSPALDLASYAANLTAAAPEISTTSPRSLDASSDAYRPPPADLDWYLAAMVLRRFDRGLRRFKKDWPRTGPRRLLGFVERVAPVSSELLDMGSLQPVAGVEHVAGVAGRPGRRSKRRWSVSSTTASALADLRLGRARPGSPQQAAGRLPRRGGRRPQPRRRPGPTARSRPPRVTRGRRWSSRL